MLFLCSYVYVVQTSYIIETLWINRLGMRTLHTGTLVQIALVLHHAF